MVSLDWDEPGFSVMFFQISAIFYYVACIFFAVFQFCICWFNMHRLEERPFIKKFGSIWAGKVTKDKGFIWYNLMYIGRRMMLGMLVVLSRNVLFFCISGLVMQTILAMIVAGSTRAHDTRRANDMEYFNEVMILMVLYNIMCFTDF